MQWKNTPSGSLWSSCVTIAIQGISYNHFENDREHQESSDPQKPADQRVRWIFLHRTRRRWAPLTAEDATSPAPGGVLKPKSGAARVGKKEKHNMSILFLWHLIPHMDKLWQDHPEVLMILKSFYVMSFLVHRKKKRCFHAHPVLPACKRNTHGREKPPHRVTPCHGATAPSSRLPPSHRDDVGHGLPPKPRIRGMSHARGRRRLVRWLPQWMC